MIAQIDTTKQTITITAQADTTAVVLYNVLDSIIDEWNKEYKVHLLEEVSMSDKQNRPQDGEKKPMLPTSRIQSPNATPAFNAEKYFGDPGAFDVYTRSGRRVMGINTCGDNPSYPIRGLVDGATGIYEYTPEGRFRMSGFSGNDLFMYLKPNPSTGSLLTSPLTPGLCKL